ncbi:phosphoribosylaminoimidazole carboxylase [Candidatus Tenderia electrophaga]|jgi:5-(carboxyamino)imidazole ribonucleotide synthase|uniref:N5-carboxyaminoimidazole ribonucleotide synthase n=1 Tax=Candidatus Tenderia electrophaga TaxID=1748243 RepID=A0A0S2TA63_9GAMM|nr:phosphoribosylaminoimidazole carboxylase [Candidatus Tenderia electrophaga]
MVVGILGGGQLARMLALAGYPLGLNFIVLDPAPDVCAAPVAEHMQGDYDDQALLAELAQQADIVTYEFENVPAQAVAYLADKVAVYPPPQALAAAQDRLNEKTLFRRLGVDTPDFVAVNSLEELQQAMDQVGWPAVVKTRTQGYDGKGQAILKRPDDLAPAWQSLGGVPAIVEAFVPFAREVSIIAVRSTTAEVVCYPLTENSHRDGVLRLSIARPDDPMQGQAASYAARLMKELDYVGVLALELFQADNRLLANEFAPRVHNSGHWTQDGAATCQFENHLRAVLGLPLGSTDAVGHSAMVNLVGTIPAQADVLVNSHAHLHLYGKAPRPGRKVGHINLCAESRAALEAGLKRVLALAGE